MSWGGEQDTGGSGSWPRESASGRPLPPPCPECGGRPVALHVGVVLMEREVGSIAERSRPAPGAPPRVECENGHWYAVMLDGPRLTGEPERVYVTYEPGGMPSWP